MFVYLCAEFKYFWMMPLCSETHRLHLQAKRPMDGLRISRNGMKNFAYLNWHFILNYRSRKRVIFNEESNLPVKMWLRDYITATP